MKTLESGGMTPATVADEGESNSIEQESPKTESGTVLAGRYSVEALLGAGGMGAVYRARDLELDEVVALKMLKRGPGESPTGLDRFRREVKLARRVTHKNVARTFDIGEHNGDRFLTMELVDGSPLSALVRGNPLTLERAATITRELCDGLGAAHASGVVHRDLKPDNVLIARDGRVVITDFGIARASLADDGRTQGGVMGTPAYMAPEQLEAAPDVDARADIYALGAILYEMYTGERAWTASTIYRLAADKLTQPPPNPRERRTDLPEIIADVVTKCMAKDPAQRFASAADVARAIEEATPASREEEAPATTLTAPPSSPSPVAHAPTPSPTALGKSVAVLPLRNVGPKDDEYLADGLTDDLIDTLSMSPDLRVRARGVVVRFKGSERDVCEIGRELGVSVVVEGSVRRAGDKVRVAVRLVSVADGFQLWARRFDVALGDMLAVGDDASAAVRQALLLPEAQPARASSQDPLAVDLYMRGRHEYAKSSQPATREAIKLLERANELTPDDPGILGALAMSRARMLFFTEDASSAEAALATAERAVGLAPGRVEARVALASVQIALGHFGVGAAQIERVLKAAPDNPDGLELGGRLLGEAGRIDEALVMLKHAVAIESHRRVLKYDCARLSALMGNWEDAEEALAEPPPKDLEMQYWFVRWRLVGWRRDREKAARLLPIARAGTFPLREAAISMLELVAGEAGPGPVLAHIDDRATVFRAKRRRMLMLQLRAETLGFIGDRDGTLAALEAANESLLLDLAWTDRCPLLDDLRSHPRFIAARSGVAGRAAMVSSEISRRFV